MRTHSVSVNDIERKWFVVDATDLILGRMSTEVARVLRGKHKPTYTPHLDTGDHVIIINADKVAMTKDKMNTKVLYRHSGYPGGLSEESYGSLLERRPDEAIRRTIKGMLPKNRLGSQMLTKLKVYAGPEHPHTAQQPETLTIDHARADAVR